MGMNREDGTPEPQEGAAFLLARLGSHAARVFAARIAELDLTPPLAGLLRLLASSPGLSQRELADDLGTPPSRFVALADTLEERGLIERRRNHSDRRLYALHLTQQGAKLLADLRTKGAAHERQICQALSPDEHRQLGTLLGRMAEHQGLSHGIHPGYRWIRTNHMQRPGN
ncbi:MarR family winged helix-turn-helix transcriptional regulator [Saccharopolyspora sp. 5N102]|uniref:MarR family winged helix-turn-helix transcriptional regulator n=1 Tax=Saccharopolyspora sp. 5N102 TaxID=3375155 RepID=UPI00379BEB5A